MTNYEFKAEYDKLVDVYPSNFGNEHKEKAIYNYIKDLDQKWWKALVNRIILSSKPGIDIEDAARGERLARKKIEDTKLLLKASTSFSEQMSECGLEDVLKSMGVKSLVEAITRKPEGEVNGE